MQSMLVSTNVINFNLGLISSSPLVLRIKRRWRVKGYNLRWKWA